MPQMANITVLTDKVYEALTPSSGDRTPAQWRLKDATKAAAHRPELSVSSKYSQNRQYRVLDSQFRYPFTVANSQTGALTVVATAQGKFNVAIPTGVPQSGIDDFVGHMSGLIAAALYQEMLKSGYACS